MASKDDSTKDLNLIGQGTTIEGKIRSQGSVRVDGRVVGDIHAYDAVSIGLSGEVDGNISAKNITVGGKVRGSLTAEEKLVFLTQAIVQGDIRAARLVVDEGAVLDGKCSMPSEELAKLRSADGGISQSESKPPFGTLQQKR